MVQSNGTILADIRNRIIALDRAAPPELGKSCRTPEGLRGWLLEKNDVLTDDGRGLTDGEIIESPRSSKILDTYQFSNGIIRQSATMDSPERMGRDEQDLEFRENFPAYLRTTDRHIQHEFNGNNTRWRNADTYGHTRRIPYLEHYDGEGRRDDAVGNFGAVIGISEEWLTVMLVTKRKAIMRNITLGVGVILIIYGIAL